MEVAHAQDGYEGRFSDLIITIRDVLRRRWLTLALVSVAVFVAGVALVSLMSAKYTATTSLRLDPARNPLSPGANDAQQALSPEAIETEVGFIRSKDRARQVVRKLHLLNDPDYTRSLDEKAAGGGMTPAQREDAIASNLLDSLSVARDKLTYVLNISFTSRNAAQSARIANAFAAAYIEARIGSSASTARQQSDFFQQRLDQLGAEVQAADERVAQYRARAGIVGSGATGGTIVDQQVAPLSSQLATAESDAAAARANLSAARGQIGRGDLDTVSEVLSSPVIVDLRRQRAEVLRNMGEVQARYGDKHPESIRVRDQLAGIDKQIKDESTRVVGSLQATAAAADARAGSLRGAMGRLEGARASNARDSVIADSLERQAAAKRAAYERLSQLSLSSTQAAQSSIAQADIVSRAEPPSRPTSPNKPLLYALALIVGLASGTGTIAVQEMLVRGMRTVDDVERELGIPMLAAIPRVAGSQNPADLLLDKPTSLFSEALRIARASILGVRSAKTVQVVAITSALPSEGKTTTALAFARTLAINNARTLLLDCDVRRAALRPLVREARAVPGIVEVLHGEATLDQAITPGDVPGLDQLLVSEPYFSSEDLFGTGAMEKLLRDLRGRYDMIVLDLPPLVGLADGRFLAVLADATAMVIKWDSTPAAAAAAALNSLKADEANVVGVIYTMVDSAAEAIGGLYYSKKYASYYQS